MLAIVRPERRKLLLHPASPPGGVAPRWVNAVQLPRHQGQLPVPDIDDLARLALQSCYEQVGHGDVSLKDLTALVRLAFEYQHDATLAEAERQKARADELDAALRSLVWSVKRNTGPEQWRAFATDMRREVGLLARPD